MAKTLIGNVKGPPGNNGITPHIGENGNWWIGETDTGVAATAGATAAEAAAAAAAAAASDARGFASQAQSHKDNALNYANDANTAKSAAVTAQGKAETAQANAEKAKEDAESAKEAAASSASGAGNLAVRAETAANNANIYMQNASGYANEAKGYRDEVKDMLDNAEVDPANAVLVIEQTLTEEQKAQARENIGAVGKNSLTLGVHTDGLIYLFVDGSPVGNGIEQGVSGDVVGYVDADNNIVLTGALPEGAVYNVKYEMADGTTVNIGELSLVQAVEIINQIPISTDADGNLFVGTNGEKGYKTGYRLSGSSGNESALAGIEVTGFIPVKYADKVYMKGITDDGAHIIGVYKSDHSTFATANITQVCGGAISGEVVSFTIDTHFGSGTITSSSGVAFIRVSANEITADSIITVNQAIE